MLDTKAHRGNMSTMTKDDMRVLLFSMGTNPYAVARVLIACGVKGVRRSYEKDPVTVYLRKLTGLDTVEVTELDVHWSNPGELQWLRIPTPPSIREFIHRFDLGGFPGLDSGEASCFLCRAGIHEDCPLTP